MYKGLDTGSSYTSTVLDFRTTMAWLVLGDVAWRPGFTARRLSPTVHASLMDRGVCETRRRGPFLAALLAETGRPAVTAADFPGDAISRSFNSEWCEVVLAMLPGHESCRS